MQSMTCRPTITVLGPPDLSEILFDSLLDACELLSLCGGSIHPRGFGAVAVTWNAAIFALAAGRSSEIALAVPQPAGPTSGWGCHSSWSKCWRNNGMGGRLSTSPLCNLFPRFDLPSTLAFATAFLPKRYGSCVYYHRATYSIL